ncbi:MAG: LacI family DNA-binding transcriptional regulator [Planctomycetota bacterium]|jgi:DNA-binding LacI/PurR family transcriptional regulator
MAVTIKDIAQACGVDPSTVSRALRGDERVHRETKTRIVNVAAEMGYRPNLTARNLVSGKTHTIWMLVGSYDNVMERVPLQVASQLFAEEGYDLLSALHQYDLETFGRLVERLRQGVSDGAILIPGGNFTAEMLAPLLESGFPLLTIDRPVVGTSIPLVTTDNAAVSRRLVRWCWDAGCRRFALLHHRSNAVDAARLEAALDEIDRLGGDFVGAEELTGKALKGGDDGLAVLASGQEFICSFFDEMGDALAGVPLTAACYDRWLGRIDPAQRVFLAVQDFPEIARRGVALLREMIEDNRPMDGEVISIPALEIQTLT